MQAFIQFLYTYGEEISLISGIISILSAIGTVISYLKIKIAKEFSAMAECRCQLPKFHKVKRHKVFARYRKQQRKSRTKQFEIDEEKFEPLIDMELKSIISISNNNTTQENSGNNGISNSKISNSKIVVKGGSNNTVALICFFGFLSLTVICATICFVVYFVTH